MHKSSMIEMEKFVHNYLCRDDKLRILDVGSYNVNGSYKRLFNNSNWEYVGLDLSKGPNVDIITENQYNWPIPDRSFDVVISGQCLEHVKDTHKWMREVGRVLKYKGLVCIIAPYSYKEHRYPIDCWRIFPDGMKFLLNDICNLVILKVYKNDLVDCIGIASKL